MARTKISVSEVFGSGVPRLVVEYPDDLYSSASTTFTDTTCVIGGSPDLTILALNMRCWALTTGAEFTFGKITDVDDGTDTITVEEWSNGTPPNGATLYVNGWVIDLPYCETLVERFEPDYIVHPLYGGFAGARLISRWRGWKYTADLVYSTYLSGETLYDLRPALNMDVDDKLILIPRKSAPGFQYNVIYAETISVAPFGYQKGHKGVIIKLRGTENVGEWPIQAGYGFNYARDYGTGL
jgi:hypothetical protein